MKTAYPSPNDDHRPGSWLLTAAVVLAAAGGAFALYKLLQAKAGAPAPPVPPAPPTTPPTPPTPPVPPTPPTPPTPPAPPTPPGPPMPPVPPAPPVPPTPTPRDLLKKELATTSDFRARVILAAKYHNVNLDRPQDYQLPSHTASYGPHTVDGYFGAVYGAAIMHNRVHQLGWVFTEKDFFEVENELLLDPKILADIAGHRGAPALDIRKKVQEEKSKLH